MSPETKWGELSICADVFLTTLVLSLTILELYQMCTIGILEDTVVVSTCLTTLTLEKIEIVIIRLLDLRILKS